MRAPYLIRDQKTKMIVYYDDGRAEKEARMLPYTPADSTQSGFIDFTKNPELIETVLEDFINFSHTPAVKTFYDFLRWVNGPNSHLTTCDCVLRPPAIHSDRNSSHHLSTHGRIYILFRDLRNNCALPQSDWLCERMMAELAKIDQDLPPSQGVVGFTKQPALHEAISNGVWHEKGFESDANDPGLGHHLMLSFWAYGDTEKEAFANLERVYRNIWTAARRISDLIQEAVKKI